MPDSRISRVRFEALAFLPRAFPAWRGLSAGSHTPQLPWFAHSLVPPQASALRQHCVWPPRCSMDPPSAQSPFAPMLVFPSSGRRVHHLLRGRYASVIAPTDSFANPVWLFLPSAIASCKKSSQVATSPCCHRDFPDVISANLSSDAWSLATAVPRSAYTCFFLRVIGLPQQGCGSASRFNPRTRLFAEAFFRGCRHSFMFRPPSLLVSQIVPTAAHIAAGQPRLLRPGRACFVTSARTGHASRPNTGN